MASGSLRNFSSDVLKVLVENSDENVFFSPVGIFVSLAMLLVGTRNDSSNQIKRALKLDMNASKIEIHASIKKMIEAIKWRNGDTILLISNGIFLDKNFDVQQEYVNDLQKFYEAEVKKIDVLDSTGAVDRINEWIEAKTNDKIQNIMKKESINHQTRMVLANALYLNGNFSLPFRPSGTTSKPFHLNKYSKYMKDTMKQIEKFNYHEDADTGLRMLEMPFKYSSYSLLVMLPTERFGLQAILNRLDGAALLRILKSLETYEVSLSLPQFKVETTMSLDGILQKLGVTDIFDSHKADLSGISVDKKKLYISEAVQKTFLDVNEYGVEAAAATAITIVNTSFQHYPSTSFVVDEPFLVAIYNSHADDVIFLGRISKP